ncbi:hypothetical protein EIP86_009663 [Pleurotus ostreatoroseus]|nr:hypothetical protein EIP86_009663 [Pleurotus ostreatoroseus]
MWAFVKYSGKGLVWTTNDFNTVALGFIVILEHHGAGIRVLARAISIYCISDVVTIGQEWHVWLAWGADVYGSSGSGMTPEEPYDHMYLPGSKQDEEDDANWRE